MQNKMTDLRNHLFATLEALKDEDKPMPLDRAQMISVVAQTIINSAKVEVDFLKTMDGTMEATPFFDAPALDVRLDRPSGGMRRLPQ